MLRYFSRYQLYFKEQTKRGFRLCSVTGVFITKTCLECGGYEYGEHEVGFEVLPLFTGAPQTLRGFTFVIRTHLVVLIILYKTNSENSLFLVK